MWGMTRIAALDSITLRACKRSIPYESPYECITTGLQGDIRLIDSDIVSKGLKVGILAGKTLAVGVSHITASKNIFLSAKNDIGIVDSHVGSRQGAVDVDAKEGNILVDRSWIASEGLPLSGTGNILLSALRGGIEILDSDVASEEGVVGVEAGSVFRCGECSYYCFEWYCSKGL